MANEKNSFALIARHMQRRAGERSAYRGDLETPTIADLIRRIDRALLDRRAA